MPDRLYQYTEHAEPALVPAPDFNWFQPPPEYLRQHPRRQSAGESRPSAKPPLTPDVDWRPLTDQPLFRHGRRQTAGLSWPAQTAPLEANVEWFSLTGQPLFGHPPRQTAGLFRDTDVPSVVTVPDGGWKLADQPFFPFKRRQTAGLSWDPSTPFGIYAQAYSVTTGPYVIIQRAGMAPWHPATFSPDGGWALANQPYLLPKRRQAAGLAWDSKLFAVVVPDGGWTLASQPYFPHPRRQAAGSPLISIAGTTGVEIVYRIAARLLNEIVLRGVLRNEVTMETRRISDVKVRARA